MSASKPRLRAWLIGLAVVGGLAALNGHFVYVAVSSQPDCVPHLKAPDGSGHFQAAKSAC
jgi:hypothetical protein